MDYVRPHFHVIEDKPAHVPAWKEPYKAQADAPISVAATRANADVIVTANLTAGPPSNGHGVPVFNNVLYLDPEHLPAFLDRWGDISQIGSNITVLEDESTVAHSAGDVDGDVMPGLIAFQLDVVRRRSGLPDEPTPEQLTAPSANGSWRHHPSRIWSRRLLTT